MESYIKPIKQSGGGEHLGNFQLGYNLWLKLVLLGKNQEGAFFCLNISRGLYSVWKPDFQSMSVQSRKNLVEPVVERTEGCTLCWLRRYLNFLFSSYFDTLGLLVDYLSLLTLILLGRSVFKK